MYSPKLWKVAEDMYTMGRHVEVISDRTGISATTIEQKAIKEKWEKPSRLNVGVSSAIDDLGYVAGKWSHLLTFIVAQAESQADELIALLRHVDEIDKLTNAIQRVTRAREGLLNQEHAMPHIALIEWAVLIREKLKERLSEEDFQNADKLITELEAIKQEEHETLLHL